MMPDHVASAEGGWPPNLLARIAATVGRRRQEDVASTALLYLLQSDESARWAIVEDLASRAGLTVGVEWPHDLSFAGQDQGEDGRPDIVGADASACARVIIEAKIDAGFHSDQIGRYSTRLDPGTHSVMVVLAPERRVPRLLENAAKQLKAKGIELAESAPGVWRAADNKLTLVGISWKETLEVIGKATSSADLDQLRGFYEYLESDAFLPFATADLARANGRLMRSVASIAENVAADLDGSRSFQWDSTGILFTPHTHKAWFGVWLEAWAQREDTPYWLTYSKRVLPPARAAQLLPELNAIPGIRAHQDNDFLCIALFPPTGVGRAEVVKAVKGLIVSVSDLVL